MNVAEKLNDVFRQVFDNEEIVISPVMTANDVDGWDSLSHVNLILAIETAFRISFTQRELLTFRNVGDLISSIEKKIVKQSN
ncbi:MAG: acyl carrier protein [Candidatus Wallbacteria bacterium]|nr:acyl carrier protein [Candidatus Wallbacteria bacterium]